MIEMRLLSTLGWSADVIIEISRVLEPEENIVFYGYVDEIERERIMAAIKKLEISLDKLRLVKVNPMSLKDCFEKMRNYISEESVVNITGGTKIMAFSLALEAALRDIPIVYMYTEGDIRRIKRIPLSISYAGRNFLNFSNDSTPLKILRLLVKKYNGKARLKDIKRDIPERRSSTISDAKRKLIKANLIREEKNGRDKIIILNSGSYLFVRDD